MPQPESTTNTASGAEALLAAANRPGRRPRHVPAPKAGAGKPDAVDPAETPPADTKVVAEGLDTGSTPEGAQAPAEPPESGKAEPPGQGEAPDSPREDVADAPKGEVRQEETGGGEIAFPQKPLDYNQLFAKRAEPQLDAAILTMLRERQTKVVKSLASIMNMFLDRQKEYGEAIDYALKLGMPKEEMMKIAVAHDCVPLLTALLQPDDEARPQSG